METKIDNVKTIEKVRKRYGSVRAFCRLADITFPHFYMILRGDRGHAKANKGPEATKAPLIIKRLRKERLLVTMPVNDVVNG